jgi:hypothetical protein
MAIGAACTDLSACGHRSLGDRSGARRSPRLLVDFFMATRIARMSSV